MNILQKACEGLGKANLPVYTVVAVAAFKGILRPTFTMMDKKQNPDTKKYAAIREGSTELIAIPTYIGLSALTQKLAPAFSPKGKNYEQMLSNSKTTLGFVGVCAAALFVIPKLCNMAMPTIMKAFNGKKSNDKNTFQNSVQPDNAIQKRNPIRLNSNSPFTKVSTNFQGGLKI